MNTNILVEIQNIEEKWLNTLSGFCFRQFEKSHLPSHDALHHHRVWNYAKKLVLTFSDKFEVKTEQIEQLIIACFFHDQGMSIDTSAKHGLASRNLCEQFFEAYSDFKPASINLIYEAVEKHDDKSYFDTQQPIDRFELLRILNLADDLDAFGYMGIYRYSEIYLLRNFPDLELANKVIENISGRFNHLKQVMINHNTWIIQQKSKFEITLQFFKHLKNQLEQNFYTNTLNDGPVTVLNFIKKEILTNKKPLTLAIQQQLMVKNNSYLFEYLNKLKFEI